MQIPALPVHIWARNIGVGVSQWAAETMGIWQDQGGLTTQWIDNKVRERVRVIAQSMSSIKKQRAGTEQWVLLINRHVTPISDLESNRPLWKWNMADKINLDGQKLKAALHEFPEIGILRRKNMIEETPTKQRTLMHCGMYFFSPMLLLLFLIIC
jgi:hypothetical protein